MGQITVTKPNSSTLVIGGSNPLVYITQAEQSMTLMGEDVVNLTVESSVSLNVTPLDTIEVFGKIYTLFDLPEVKRESSRKLIYRYKFKASVHELERVMFQNEDATGVYYSSDFSLMADMSGFLDVICTNMNRVYGSVAWVKGTVPTSQARNLTFSNETCLAVLSRLATEFNLEYQVIRVGNTRTINIATKIGRNLSLSDYFSYGRGRGLKSIERKVIASENIITRLFAFGSDKNITSNYRNYSQRLKLPVATAGGEKSYLNDTDTQAVYGIIEGVKTFDDIFPRRAGTVSSLGANIYEFIDSSIDFNVNTYLVSGLAAKVNFKTGRLAGYEFTLKSFDNATKKFTINKITDERGLEIPNSNSAFKIAVGDQYTILDITLPATYITNAEQELQLRAQAWLDENKLPKVNYEAETDDLFLKNNPPSRDVNEWYLPGDTVRIDDSEIAGGMVYIRIASLTRDIIVKERYKFTFSNNVYRRLANRLNIAVNQASAIFEETRMNNPASRRLESSSKRIIINEQSQL